MITWLAGPPFNLKPGEIGWLNRQQIQTLYLRHRNKDGLLDLEAVLASRRAARAEESPPADLFAEFRYVRRMQGFPEHRIDEMVREMGGSNGR